MMPVSSQLSEREELNLSSTVSEASRQWQEHESVTAATFAKAILARHSEYAGGKASAVSLDEGRAEQKRPVQVWLTDIRTLYDRSVAPTLHGRLVILGLSYLEPDLQGQLQRDGFLTALEQELKEPLNDLLTDRGRALREPSDSVPIQPDDPLCLVADDQLGRAAFARYLAARIGASGPLATRGAKRIMNARRAAGFAAARSLSDDLRHALEWSHDVDEGMAAHREGRSPRFTGR